MVTFIPKEVSSSNAVTGVPQVHFDQLVIMSHHNNAVQHDTAPCSKPLEPPQVIEAMILNADANGQLRPRVTRAYLQKQKDWLDWKSSEYSQLNSYHS